MEAQRGKSLHKFRVDTGFPLVLVLYTTRLLVQVVDLGLTAPIGYFYYKRGGFKDVAGWAL